MTCKNRDLNRILGKVDCCIPTGNAFKTAQKIIEVGLLRYLEIFDILNIFCTSDVALLQKLLPFSAFLLITENVEVFFHFLLVKTDFF